jgi:hypothetical protein
MSLTDSSCFYIIGKGIISGMVPYIDFFDNKGIILYFINAFPQLFISSRFGLWVQEVIYLFLTLFFISRIAVKLEVKKPLYIFSVNLFYLIVFSTFVDSGNMSEEYSCLFIAAAFYTLVALIKSPFEKMKWRYGISFGILFTLCFLTRPNNALPIFAIIAVISFSLLFKKKFGLFFRFALSFIIGSAMILLPCIIYLASRGALSQCIYQTITMNFLYPATGSSKLELLMSVFGIKCLLLLAISIVGTFCAFVLGGGEKEEGILYYSVGISALLAAISAFFSGFSYDHYLLLGALPAAVGLIMSIKAFLYGKEKDIHFLKISLKYASFAVVALSISAILCYFAAYRIPPQLKLARDCYTGYFGENKAFFSKEEDARELVSMIPKNERDSFFAVIPTPGFYVYGDIMPCKRLFVCQDFFINIIDGMKEEFRDYFVKDPPKWLLMNADIASNETGKTATVLIAEKYELVKNNGNLYLYRLAS